MLSILTEATMPSEILKFRVGKVAGKLIMCTKIVHRTKYQKTMSIDDKTVI